MFVAKIKSLNGKPFPSLPKPPAVLKSADAEHSKALEARNDAIRHVRITRGRVGFGDSPPATQDEIAAADAQLSIAEATYVAALARRDAFRHAYQADCRTSLAPALAGFCDDLAVALDRVSGLLDAGAGLHRDAKAAGINLDDGLTASAARLADVVRPVRTAVQRFRGA